MVFIALIHKLMCTGNELEVVDMVELVGGKHVTVRMWACMAGCRATYFA